MGVLPPRVEAKIPDGLAYLYQFYNEARFSAIPIDNALKLAPREALTFTELKSFMNINQIKLSSLECDAIMRIDAIFNNAT